VCAVLVCWLLLFARVGVRGAGLTAVLLAGIAVSVAVATARGDLAGVRSGTGVALSVAGLAGLVVALDYHTAGPWTVLAGAALVAGPALTCAGLRAAHVGDRVRPATRGSPFPRL